MLSETIIVNALLVQSILTGHVPCAPAAVETVKEQSYQEVYVSSNVQVLASRDAITVTAAPVQTKTVTLAQLPSGAANSGLVGSALKYVGTHWDCTMLVEQALRDLGYSVPDMGPMQFGSFGSVFTDPSQVQAGDIMMRPGHVAIYAGDGMSVQGGFGFGGVVYNSWEGPYDYVQFVRVG